MHCRRKRTRKGQEELREGRFWVNWCNTTDSVGEFDGGGVWGLELVELMLII